MEHINGGGYEIKENKYQRNGVTVAYPTIVSEADNEKLDSLNNIIRQDIGRILSIYSAYAYVLPPDGKELDIPDTLSMTYEIKRNDDRYLSIVYAVNFYSPYAAYPTQMIYTTNIEKKNDRRVMLSDFISNVRSLADNIYSWDIVAKDYDIMDYPQAVRDYISGLGKEVLYMGFESADIIGTGNFLGIYSYLTPDKLGISISLPHFLGDHVEYERDIPV